MKTQQEIKINKWVIILELKKNPESYILDLSNEDDCSLYSRADLWN